MYAPNKPLFCGYPQLHKSTVSSTREIKKFFAIPGLCGADCDWTCF